MNENVNNACNEALHLFFFCNSHINHTMSARSLQLFPHHMFSNASEVEKVRVRIYIISVAFGAKDI